MEGLRHRSEFTRRLSRLLPGEFTLVDIGCGGGIDAAWRNFRRLRAFGFDPNPEECARLNSLARGSGVEYVPGFVGLPHGHALRGRTKVSRNPWSRLSAARSYALIDRTNKSEAELMRLNLWRETSLADPDKPVVLSEFLKARDVSDVDFVKIDVDGEDLEVLLSLEDLLGSVSVLGLGIEVNYIGSESRTDNTLHNVDRFMRAAGFDLFGLTVRRYSAAALPAPYQLSIPAQTTFGRPLQGDALYLRDFAAPENEQTATSYGVEKLARLACLFDLFGLPDCAAELLLTRSDALAEVCELEPLLDLLVPANMSYHEYLERFERNDPMFFPARRAASKVAKGWKLLRGRD